MVDRDARDQAIHVLGEFRFGVLTNAEIDRQWPHAPSDTGLTEIGVMLSGAFFIDVETYRLTDEGHGSAESANMVDRCMAFLRTDRQVGKPIRPLRGSVTHNAIVGTLALPLAWWYAWGLEHIWVTAVVIVVGWLVLAVAIKRELEAFREAKARYDDEFEEWLEQRKSVEKDADPDWWPFHDRNDYEQARRHMIK